LIVFRSPRKIASLMAALRPLGAECFFTNFITGSTGITGWTVVGPEASIVSTNYAALGFTYPAEDGQAMAGPVLAFLSNSANFMVSPFGGPRTPG
jgi:hypothetical protein